MNQWLPSFSSFIGYCSAQNCTSASVVSKESFKITRYDGIDSIARPAGEDGFAKFLSKSQFYREALPSNIASFNTQCNE